MYIEGNYNEQYPSSFITNIIDENIITVNDSTGFKSGDYIFIWYVYTLNSYGLFELHKIENIEDNNIIIRDKTKFIYNSSEKILVFKFIYDKYIEIGNLTCDAWNGNTGGIIPIMGKDIVINGEIDVSAKGFRGGAGHNVRYEEGHPGESYNGISNKYTTNRNYIGGGGGNEDYTIWDWRVGTGGGGGGNYTPGNNGKGCYGGLSIPDAINRVSFGGGGGSGGEDNSSNSANTGNGGSGGGILFIIAKNIIINNNIKCCGADGESTYYLPGTPREAGGGGGGAGGTVYLLSNKTEINNESTINIIGGTGGISMGGAGGQVVRGGNGGEGKVKNIRSYGKYLLRNGHVYYDNNKNAIVNNDIFQFINNSFYFSEIQNYNIFRKYKIVKV